MKITFSNLGAIKKTTLDLRPLTVIIGPNNSNKTYIAYSIYGLLKHLGNTANSSFLMKLGLGFDNEKLRKTVKNLYEIDQNDIYTLKFTDEFFQHFTEDCLDQITSFQNRLGVFFQDSSGKIFKDTSFNIKFTKDEVKLGLRRLENITEQNFGDSLKTSFNENVLYIRSTSNFFDEVSLPQQVALSIGFDMKRSIFLNPVLLPAERNTLITTYKILETRRYDLLRNIDRESIKHPTFVNSSLESIRSGKNIRYPEPIEDFLKFLTSLEIDSPERKGKFSKLANSIESNLQRGNKTKYINVGFENKEIKINVKRNLDIDLYNASSSIKQLAPLLLYLRYRAKEGDLLIIDEPEMNLHPESQAKLLEVLAMLVNEGVKILLTTHSPYFMSHLNNLISGDMNNENVREKQAKSLYLTDERAFLKPEDVSAYEMKNNKLVSLKHKDEDGDYSISWETLSDVSADIQQKFFEMYEKRETTSSGEEKE